MNPVKVEVKQYGYDFGIVGADGEWFMNHKNQKRLYTKPGSAIAFLKRTGYAWIVKMPSGRTSFVNCEETKNELGPHWWSKKNLVTLENKHGFYDVWKCDQCHKERKRYGLSGKPTPGYCKKNPIEEE